MSAPKETVLIIDDSTATRFILAKMVGELGYPSIQAENGKKALEVLKASPVPTVMLVDWNMPEMNGLEFVTAARADTTYESARIIMVTTETEMTQVIRALEAGANEYIMKPFTKEMIEDKFRLLGLIGE